MIYVQKFHYITYDPIEDHIRIYMNAINTFQIILFNIISFWVFYHLSHFLLQSDLQTLVLLDQIFVISFK